MDSIEFSAPLQGFLRLLPDNPAAVAIMADMPALRTLLLIGLSSPINIDQVPLLARLTQLTHLGIQDQEPAVISTVLKAVAELPQLRTLTVGSFGGNPSDFEHLARCPELEFLIVNHPPGDAEFDERIKAWHSDRPWMRIQVNAKQLFHGIDFAAERRAAEWIAKNLSDGHCNLKQENGSFASLTSIQRSLPEGNFVVSYISASFAGADDAGLQQLAGCRRLVNFSIGGQDLKFTGKGLDWLGQNGALTPVMINGAKVVDTEFLTQLGSLSRLESLSLPHCQGDLAAFQTCPQNSSLRSLNLTGIPTLEGQLPSFAKTFPNLRQLECQYQDSGSPRSLVSLTGHPRLESVHCSSNQLTAEGVATLQTLSQLKSLHIHSPTVDPPEALQRLSPLGDRLTFLGVYTWYDWDAGPTEADYDVLLSLPKLEEIVLGHHKGSPTDRHLEAVAKLPRLRKLRIGFGADHRRYTPAGIEALRKARADINLIIAGENDPPAPVQPGAK